MGCKKLVLRFDRTTQRFSAEAEGGTFLILTEEELNNEQVDYLTEFFSEMQNVLNAPAAALQNDILAYLAQIKLKNDHNRNLVLENDEQTAEIEKLKLDKELDKTKVKNLYLTRSKESNQKTSLDQAYYNGICRGINECLEALNIKIEDVNA